MAHKWYRWQGQDLHLRVRVQPRASRDRIVGPHGGNLKVTITAPPVEGKANAHLIRFLAKSFRVPASRVVLESGAGGREKRLCIQSPKRVPNPLAEWITID